MKKLVILVTIAVLLGGNTFAQDGQRSRRTRTPRQRELVTINGTLGLEKGCVAVNSSEETYIIPMLNRYIGFINGLQEGVSVSAEGYNSGRRSNNTESAGMFHVRKLTIDGREYVFNSERSREYDRPGRNNSRRNDYRGYNRSRPNRYYAPGRGNGHNRDHRRQRVNAPIEIIE